FEEQDPAVSRASFSFGLRIVASIPAGGFDFLLGNGTDVDLGLETIEDRAPAHVLAHDDGSAGPTLGIALPDRLAEQVDAATEIGFVPKIEWSAAVTSAHLPVREFYGVA